MTSIAPAVPSLLSLRGKIIVAAVLAILVVIIPVFNVMVPETSAFHLSDYAVSLLGKIMCYAICALAMDLIWGYTGILSLGHGLFFALGGYAMRPRCKACGLVSPANRCATATSGTR